MKSNDSNGSNPPNQSNHPHHVILWDGACGLCRRAVAWVARRDRSRRFEALPYQDAPSPPMTPELRAACGRAVHVITRDSAIVQALRERGFGDGFAPNRPSLGPMAALVPMLLDAFSDPVGDAPLESRLPASAGERTGS